MWPKRSIVLRVTNPALYPEESLRIQTACHSASDMGKLPFLEQAAWKLKLREQQMPAILQILGRSVPS